MTEYILKVIVNYQKKRIVYIRTFKYVLLSMRPEQWTKNIVIFVALLFSQNVMHLDKLSITFTACVTFCLLSGAVYLFNDIIDYKQDRIHPNKCRRPIASGILPLSAAKRAFFIIVSFSLAVAFWINVYFAIVAIAYLAIQIVYSVVAKHIVIIDSFSIASGFFLRVLAGAMAINVLVSSWLLICTFFLSLFLALCKRRHELVLLGKNKVSHRQVLGEYNTLLLDQMIAVATASSLVAYSLYTVSKETVEKFNTTNLMYTIPFVAYGIYRYLYLVYHKEEGGNPEIALFNDTPLLANVIIYAILIFCFLY